MNREALSRICGEENVSFDVPLSEYTTFRIGGPADALVRVQSTEMITQVQQFAGENGLPLFFMGNGSNILVNDEGFRGIIITPGEELKKIRVDGTKIRAYCGATLARVARAAQEAGLTGFEFASGIPGNIGGAVYMNAGAYNGEISQVVTQIEYLDADGLHVMPAEQAGFGYRDSYFMHHSCLVISAAIELAKGDPQQISALMQDLAARRREKQPLEYPSAGSMFKRPKGYFAGKLIEDAGLAGFCIGGAQISAKHCGFVINVGNATCADVVALNQAVHEIVYEKFKVLIWPEVRYLGPEGLCPMPGLEEPETA